MVKTRKKITSSTIILFVLFILFIAVLRKLPAQSSGVRPNPEVVNTPDHMIELINRVRMHYNVPPLAKSAVLNQTARNKACDMLARNYFDHNEPPDNKRPWHWFKEAGYDYEYAGENLAREQIDQYAEIIAFMDSPAHRENILSTNYKEVGVGICGEYTVQHFGAR